MYVNVDMALHTTSLFFYSTILDSSLVFTALSLTVNAKSTQY